MPYDHTKALKTVAVEDAKYVGRLLDKLDAYAQSDGREPLGHFLTAVVIGDLMEAVACADDVSVKYLREFARYIQTQIPCTHILWGEEALKGLRQMAESGLQVTEVMVDGCDGVFCVTWRYVKRVDARRDGEQGREKTR